ncbi:MAG: hypothetical protein RSD57_03930 [Comamonas sp.]
MHMLLVMMTGVLQLAVCVLLGKLWGTDAASLATGAKIFIPLWLAVTLANMWIGVNKAGYTVAQELPILLLNFAVPAALAVAVVWFMSRT